MLISNGQRFFLWSVGKKDWTLLYWTFLTQESPIALILGWITSIITSQLRCEIRRGLAKYLVLTKVPTVKNSTCHFHINCRPHRWIGEVVRSEKTKKKKKGKIYRQVGCLLWSIISSPVMQCADILSLDHIKLHQ